MLDKTPRSWIVEVARWIACGAVMCCARICYAGEIDSVTGAGLGDLIDVRQALATYIALTAWSTAGNLSGAVIKAAAEKAKTKGAS